MMSFNKAKKLISTNIKPLAPKTVFLDMHCLNTVLAENIFSCENIPNCNNSSMDGYAVKSADTQRIPVILKVTDEVRAGGYISKKIKNGEAVKIMTGGPIPDGADAVVMAENTLTERRGTPRLHSGQARKEERVKILKPVKRGENIRTAGEDIKKGELILKKGIILKAAGIGLLASIGKIKIKIIPRPKIAIITTGDEIVDTSTKKLSKGKVRNSNIWTLAMLIKRDGGIPIPFEIIPDNLHKIKNALKKAAAAADAVIISAGISAGEYDFVKTALQELGAKLIFRKIAMKPGKPLAFSKMTRSARLAAKRVTLNSFQGLKAKTVPIFSLPGNPVSTMVTYEKLVRQAIIRMAGKHADELPHETAILRHTIHKEPGRKEFMRGVFVKKGKKYFVKSTGAQGSGILKSMSKANCFIILDDQTTSAKKGTPVNIEILI